MPTRRPPRRSAPRAAPPANARKPLGRRDRRRAARGCSRPPAGRRPRPARIKRDRGGAGECQRHRHGNPARRRQHARHRDRAVADAPSAAIAMRGSNRRTSSSSTNTAPAIGALKAVARPAPAPAASSTLAVRPAARDTFADEVGDARAHLHARPFAAERQPGADREQPAEELDRHQTIRARAAILRADTASTCGMPLPDACGEKRRTSQAASATALAQPAVTSRKPKIGATCAHAISASRQRPPARGKGGTACRSHLRQHPRCMPAVRAAADCLALPWGRERLPARNSSALESHVDPPRAAAMTRAAHGAARPIAC